MKTINYFLPRNIHRLYYKKVDSQNKNTLNNLLPEANLLRPPHVVLYLYIQQPTSDRQSHLPSHAQRNEVQSDIENERKIHKLKNLINYTVNLSEVTVSTIFIIKIKNDSVICD